MQQQRGLYPTKLTAGRAVDQGMDAATSWAVAHFPALTQLPLQRWTGWSGHAEHFDPLAQTCHLLGFRNGCKHEVGFYGC